MTVTLQVINQAKRVGYRFDPRKALLLDDRGRQLRIDLAEQRILDRSNNSRSSGPPPIRAGELATFDLVFSVPSDFSHAKLEITAGESIGDFLEALTYGSKRNALDR